GAYAARCQGDPDLGRNESDTASDDRQRSLRGLNGATLCRQCWMGPKYWNYVKYSRGRWRDKYLEISVPMSSRSRSRARAILCGTATRWPMHREKWAAISRQ